MAGSASTLTEKNLSIPQAFSICTAICEKPHCGNWGVPFMYSTTGCVVTCSRMVSCAFMAMSSVWRLSLYRSRRIGETLLLHRAGEARDVVLDEERVQDRHGQRSEQRPGHQRPPVVDVAFHQLGDHTNRHGLHL